MRTLLTVPFVVLLSVAAGSMAAEVEYQHPDDVTIVAVNETLDSVLKTLGKEMQITVTVPAGLNPVINCDIQNKPVKRAFKTLLGDLSYSLVWEDGGERLAGLIILSGDGETVVVTAAPQESSPVAAVPQPVAIPVESRGYRETATVDDQYDNESRLAEHESRMEAERQEREARMVEDREVEEAEMEQRRQEEEVAHEARMKEEEVRHKAWMADYIDTHGPKPNP